MIQKLRHIISLLLVLLLLTPIIVKLKNHHEHFVCHANNENHVHTYHEKCSICSFEFSDFSFNKTVLFSKVTETIFKNRIPGKTVHNSFFSKYSFLLRAPPLFTNNNQCDFLKFV